MSQKQLFNPIEGQFDLVQNLADVDEDILPGTDITWDLGSASFRFAQGHIRQVFAIDPSTGTATMSDAGVMFGKMLESNSGDSRLTASAPSSFASGYVIADGVGSTAEILADRKASFAFGYAACVGGLDSRIYAHGFGSFAFGKTYSYLVPGRVYAAGPGTFSGGYIYDYGGTGTLHEVKSSGTGSFAWGSAGAYSPGGNVSIISSGAGSVALGQVNTTGSSNSKAYLSATSAGGFAQGSISANNGTCRIRARRQGAFAQGRISSAFNATALIDNYGQGAFTQGYVSTTGGVATRIYANVSAVGGFCQGFAGGANLDCLASGAFSQGYALQSSITASGKGAMARGSTGNAGAGNNNAITASGAGALAMGSALNGTIVASAANAFQLGPGTNSTADSLQVGSVPGILLEAAGNVNIQCVDDDVVCVDESVVFN